MEGERRAEWASGMCVCSRGVTVHCYAYTVIYIQYTVIYHHNIIGNQHGGQQATGVRVSSFKNSTLS